MSLPTNPAAANGHTPNVLIVEDDAATRRLYKFMLTNGGYPVIEAEDGVAALEQLAKHHCELVITDMNMPRMDGMELIQSIRRDYADMYVILITAFGTPTPRSRPAGSARTTTWPSRLISRSSSGACAPSSKAAPGRRSALGR